MRELKFVSAGVRIIAVATAEATDTGLTVGALYRISCTGTAACRFGATAVSVADGGADFFVQPGDSVTIRAPSATLRAIRVLAVDGTLFAQRIDEGV